jgi:hypothetical protein
MNCEIFQGLLEEAVENRTACERTDVLEHAAACAACAALLDQQLVLDRAIAQWRQDVPQVDLAESVLSSLAFDAASMPRLSPATAATSASTRRPVPWRGFALPIGAAAAVLALSALLLVIRPAAQPPRLVDARTREISPAPTVVADASTVQDDADASDQVEPSAMVRDAGSAYWTLASRTASALTDGIALVSPVEFVPSARESVANEADNSPSWMDELGSDLAPLRDDFSRAIDSLLEAVPAETSL